MTKVTKYRDDVLGWQRKSGPLRVWRVVEGRKKTDDEKTLRFSIQEIPDDRFDDVLDKMSTIFVRDEPTCQHTRVIDEPVSIEDFRKLWSFALQKGSVVGAFLVDEDNPKPVLAGVNMTLVTCEITEKTLETGIEMHGTISKKLLGFMHDMETEKNARKVYNVDKWITAFGLCVDPHYRGQGLAFHLLDARKEMSVAYNIRATTTVFTAPAAQRSAAQAGFEIINERDFVDIRNEDGSEKFPGIPLKSAILMGKRFSD